MTKARRVRKALEQRYLKVRQRGSHITFLVKGRAETYAYHDQRDLGDRQLRRLATKFGMTLDELKRLL